MSRPDGGGGRSSGAGTTPDAPLLPQCGRGLREKSAGGDSCSDHSCPPSGKSAYNCFDYCRAAGVRTMATNARIKRNTTTTRSLSRERKRMAATSFTINGKAASVEAEPDTPLLWVVREHLKLTGTKFGCGSGLCGACTVHIDGKAVRSCQISVSKVAGQKGHHHRRPVAERPASAAEGLGRRAGAAMRLLPVRPDHAGGGAARHEQEADARADRHAHGRQHLPLRHLSAHRARHSTRGSGGLSHDHSDQERFDRYQHQPARLRCRCGQA